MNIIADLFNEHCSTEVSYYRVDEICSISRGKVMSKDFIKENAGDYPVYSSQTENDGELGRISSYDFDGEYLTWTTDGANAGTVFYRSGKFSVTNVCGLLKVNKDNILTRYLYYTLSVEAPKYVNSGMGNPKLMSNVMARVTIPVPPIEVQSEIVRVLDNFMELTEELTEELSARKKQYEYYKDALLPFEEDEVDWRSLGDISTIVRGASPRPIKNYVTDDENGVNWIKIGDVSPEAKYITRCAEKITPEGAKKSRFVKPGDFILSNSMSFGRPYILQIEGCIHDGWLAISDFENYVSPDYLYHILTSSHIQREMRQKASFGGAVQNLNADIVRGIEIPIPSKEEQSRIVSVLDRFSLLCTDITSGLPAEIEVRRQQYEYYRDKLLEFKEKK